MMILMMLARQRKVNNWLKINLWNFTNWSSLYKTTLKIRK
jgi:hypothetical protein